MFIKRDLETKEKSLTTLAKLVISIFTIISMVGGAVLYLENTYMHKAAATELKNNIEKQTVTTFKMLQQNIHMEQQFLKKSLDLKELENLRDHKIILQEELKSDPNNELLKHSLELINIKIKKLQTRVYD